MKSKIIQAYDSINLSEKKNEYVLNNLLESIEGGMVMNKSVKRRKTFSVVFAVTLAVVLTAYVGAAAVKFYHKNSVEKYSNLHEYISANKLQNGNIYQNEHFKITVDTILNDGHRLYFVLNIEALDNKAKEYINSTDSFEMNIFYTDAQKQPITSVGAIKIIKNDGQLKNSVDCLADFSLADINKSKKIKMILCDEKQLCKDIEIPLDNKPNIPCETLYNDKGEEVFFSDIALTFERDINRNANKESITSRDLQLVKLIKNDGSYEEILKNDHKIWSIAKDESFLFFGENKEVKNYKGIEIKSEKYLKENKD